MLMMMYQQSSAMLMKTGQTGSTDDGMTEVLHTLLKEHATICLCEPRCDKSSSREKKTNNHVLKHCQQECLA